MAYLIAAYAIIVGAILGYVLTLWLRERSAWRSMQALLESGSRSADLSNLPD